MNFVDAFHTLQDLRLQLDTWGVNVTSLLVAGGLAFLFFILSLREVLSWYLRVQAVRSEVRALRAQMNEMQTALNETRDLLRAQAEGARLDEAEALENQKAQEPLKPEPAVNTTASGRFRLDH